MYIFGSKKAIGIRWEHLHLILPKCLQMIFQTINFEMAAFETKNAHSAHGLNGFVI